MAHTDTIACIFAFWMGYAASQGTTCQVAAAQEMRLWRRPRLFLGLLAVSATAGLVAVPLAWSGLAGVRLADSTDVSVPLLLGAVSFGVGALINDTCLLGSLGRLGSGEIRLIAMPFGLGAGLHLTNRIIDDRHLPWPSVLTAPSKLGLVTLASFLIVAILSLIYISRRPGQRSDRSWPLSVSMPVLGISGGALYVTALTSNYVDMEQRSPSFAPAALDETAILTVAASIAGALTAAFRLGKWRLRMPTLPAIAKSIIGGVLMGVGLALIPGGNNRLILAAIPALSPGGAIAYLLMTATIILGLPARDLICRKRTTP